MPGKIEDNPRGKLADGPQALTSALFVLWCEGRVSFYYQYNRVMQIWSALTERNPGQSLWWTTNPLLAYSHKHTHSLCTISILSLALSSLCLSLFLPHSFSICLHASFIPPFHSLSLSLCVCLHPRSFSACCKTRSAVTDISRHYPLAYICALDFCK